MQTNQTTVTWSISGKYNFISEAIGLVMSMDKMFGGQFEKGLAQRKSVAEAAGRNQPLDQFAEMAWIHLRLSRTRASLSAVGANSRSRLKR